MRLIAIFGTLLGWFALLLQFGLMPVASRWQFLAFFTIWSNIAATALLTRAALRPGPQDRRIALAVAVAIGMVGIIYSALLRSLGNPQGWHKLADTSLHDVMPIVFVVFFLLGPNQGLRWRDAGYALILPLAYCVYALVRGGIDGWYAYPFLDAGKLGAAAMARNIALLALAFLAMALLLTGVARFASRLRTAR